MVACSAACTRLPAAEVEQQPLQREHAHGAVRAAVAGGVAQADVAGAFAVAPARHGGGGQLRQVDALDHAGGQRGVARRVPGDAGARIGRLRQVDEFGQGVFVAGIDGVVLRHRAGGGVGRQHVARVGAVGPGRAGDDGAAGVDGWRPGPVGARWGQVQRRGGAAGQAQQQGRPGQARQQDWPGWADGQARHLRQGHGPGLPGWVRWTGRRRRARPASIS